MVFRWTVSVDSSTISANITKHFQVSPLHSTLYRVSVIHESIRVAEQIDVDGNQIITLKINFSSVLAEAGQTTEALDVLNEMIKSSKVPPAAKINVLLNKALLYKLKMNQDSDAEATMKEAVKEALAQNDAQTLLLVKQLARDNKINLL